jgi:hypothetical protein
MIVQKLGLILIKIKKRRFDDSCNYNCVDLFYHGVVGGTLVGSGPIGHVTVAAAVVSIEFSAQLLLVDSPLPSFSCFISCSVFVADSSPATLAYADVKIIPVNAAATKTEAIAIVYSLYFSEHCNYI